MNVNTEEKTKQKRGQGKIGQRFVKQTSYYDFAQTDRRQGKPQPPIYWEAEPDLPRIALPHGIRQELPHALLWNAMGNRRSRRNFEQGPLSLVQLAYLCWITQGVQKSIVFNGDATLRPVPSAGAKHAIETMLLIRRVKGLQPGLYRYLPKEHALVLAQPWTEKWEEEINHAFASNGFQRHSAVTFFWIAVPERIVWHHGQRGYRDLYLDAGHIGQNLYLAAEGLGLSACTICVFDDEKMKKLLALPGDLFLIYTAAVGNRKTELPGEV